MAKYKLTPAARDDFREIWDYSSEKWGQTQAEKYLKQLEERILDLAESPEKGRPRNEIRAGYRSFREGQHLIFYRSQKKHIEVIRVLHKRMDVRQHFEDN